MKLSFTNRYRGLALTTLLATASLLGRAQNVGIGTTTPHAAAALDVSATTKGFLPPRLTTAQRDAIAAPAAGLQVFNTSTGKLNVWNGTAWAEMLTTYETTTQLPTVSFGLTGGAQTYTVPPGVFSLYADVTGAQGSGRTSGSFGGGGKGARVQTTLAVVPGEVLTVLVGGTGVYPAGGGGFNGGGAGTYGGGGGASDIRRGAAGLADRLVVAGGGGEGGYFSFHKGGAGGTPNGAAGQGDASALGQGGTQTGGGSNGSPFAGLTSGTLGQGGSSTQGGGGGYYGGSAGVNYATAGGTFNGAGGGGSSWATPTGSSGTVYSVAASGGDGMVVLTPGPQYATPVLHGVNFVNVPAAALTGVVSTGNLPALTSTSSGTNRTLTLGTGNSTTFGVGDDLGNHTATQNLNLGTNQLVGNGGSSGLRIASSGHVGIGATTPDRPLTVQGTGTNSDLLSLKSNAGLTAWHLNLASGGLNVAETGVADYRLFVAAGGNVGLGTNLPGARLDVNGGARLASSNPLELGGGVSGKNTDAGKIGYQTFTADALDVVGAGTSGSNRKIKLWAEGGLETTGNAGIGLGNPASSSAVRLLVGNTQTSSDATLQQHNLQLELRQGTGTQALALGVLPNGYGMIQAKQANVGYSPLLLNPVAGNVGIGTSNPVARLHVSGGASAAPLAQAVTYFEANNTTLRTDNPSSTTPRSVVAYFEGGQVWVNGVIVAGALNTASDRRIKRVVGLSDRAADLALLNQLRITDYTYLDRLANTGQVVKKVIAQEVEAVLPAAVSRSRQAIPNVYEKAARVRCADGYATVTTAKPHELPATGGTLRLYTPDNRDLNVAVTVVDAHTVRFATAEDYSAGLFVYGKYVDDFRSVDYDALTTLNVSATQELARRVAALETQNAALQDQLRQQTDRTEAASRGFEQRLRALEASGGQARR